MILDICRQMAASLEPLTEENNGFITQLSGLVKTATVYNENGNVIKFPVAVDETEEDVCEDNQVSKLVPDQRKRCIVYFEGNSASAVSDNGNSTQYSSKVSIVCWYNRNGFVPVENLQTILYARIINAVKTTEVITSVISAFRMKVTGFSDTNLSTFAKYTYSDQDSAYTAYPFGFFQIDLQINFTIHENNVCSAPVSTIDLASVC